MKTELRTKPWSLAIALALLVGSIGATWTSASADEGEFDDTDPETEIEDAEDEVQPEECQEDGFQVFEPPYINLHPPSNGLSDGIHNHTEKQIAQFVDPLLTGLGLPALQPIVHEVNCEVIVPVEDAVDDLLIPIVEALDLGQLVDDLVGDLLGGLLGQ